MVEYIGVDIGGTNIRVGGMDENENILLEFQGPTFQNVTTSEDLDFKIKNLIKKIPNYQNAKAIGIGVPGSIDTSVKQIIDCDHLSLLNHFPLVKSFEQEFGVPIFLENDARVAALAEAICGKGKANNLVCYITISTGLGGGIVINKDIYHGSNNFGAYFSKMLLDGEHTSDCLISGTALCRMAQERINANIQNTESLFELYQSGNKVATQIIKEFKKHLLVLLFNICSTFNPEIILLGGGVLKSKDFFLEDVKKEFQKKVHLLAQNTVIDIAQIKEPGMIGACLLAKEKLNGRRL